MPQYIARDLDEPDYPVSLVQLSPAERDALYEQRSERRFVCPGWTYAEHLEVARRVDCGESVHLDRRPQSRLGYTFVHYPGRACRQIGSENSGETDWHLRLKYEVRDRIRQSRNYEAAAEEDAEYVDLLPRARSLMSARPDVLSRAIKDINSDWSPLGSREVQRSPLAGAAMIERTNRYRAEGVGTPIWITHPDVTWLDQRIPQIQLDDAGEMVMGGYLENIAPTVESDPIPLRRFVQLLTRAREPLTWVQHEGFVLLSNSGSVSDAQRRESKKILNPLVPYTHSDRPLLQRWSGREALHFTCPRCGNAARDDFYGPCANCRQALREAFSVAAPSSPSA